MQTETKPYRTFKPRLAKGVAIQPLDSKDGYKGPTSRLVEACGARWSGRDHAYILPKTKLETFELLVDGGWTAGIFGGLYAPGDRNTKYTYTEAKSKLRNPPPVQIPNPIIGGLPGSIIKKFNLSLSDAVTLTGDLRRTFEAAPLQTEHWTFKDLRRGLYDRLQPWCWKQPKLNTETYGMNNFAASELADHYAVACWNTPGFLDKPVGTQTKKHKAIVDGVVQLENGVGIEWQRFIGCDPDDLEHEIAFEAEHLIRGQHVHVESVEVTSIRKPVAINPIVGGLPENVTEHQSLEEQIKTVGSLRQWFDHHPVTVGPEAANNKHILRFFIFDSIMVWSRDQHDYTQRNRFANEVADHYTELYLEQQNEPTLPTT